MAKKKDRIKKKAQNELTSNLQNIIMIDIMRRVAEQVAIGIVSEYAECNNLEDAECIIDQMYYELELKKDDEN